MMMAGRMIGRTAATVMVAATVAFASLAAEASPIWVRDGKGGNVFNGGPGFVNLTIKVDGGPNLAASAGAFALQYTFTDSKKGSPPGSILRPTASSRTNCSTSAG